MLSSGTPDDAQTWGSLTVKCYGTRWADSPECQVRFLELSCIESPSPLSAFVTSDTHFGHAKMIDFLRPDGELLRPFASCEEMDETIIERWNAKVGKRDTVYHLGDVVIPRASLKLLSRLNGRKILIRGNHDQGALKDYLPYFEDVRGAFFHPCDSTFPGGLIFTHVPVHPSCLSGHYTGNVHGHLHCHRILDDNGQIDKRYFNCCLEVNDFAPVAFEDIKEFFRRGRKSSDIQHAH